MRNLVLKIVRGSYPGISPRYSQDLRSLVDSCLRHSPRERPSINGVLRLPFVQQRIESFLSETVSSCGVGVCEILSPSLSLAADKGR